MLTSYICITQGYRIYGKEHVIAAACYLNGLTHECTICYVYVAICYLYAVCI